MVVNHEAVVVVVEEDGLNHMDGHMDQLDHRPLGYKQRVLVEVNSLND
jgi:hypothetical protein